VQSYLKLRQFERFYQSFGCSPILSYSADYDVFKTAQQSINDNGIHIFSCTKKLVEHFISSQQKLKSPLVFANIKNSRLTYIQTDTMATMSQSTLAYPSAIRFDNLNYHPFGTDLTSEKTSHLITLLQKKSFMISYHNIQSLYSVLILLTLQNIHNLKIE